MALSIGRSFTRGGPRGLFGSIGLIAPAHRQVSFGPLEPERLPDRLIQTVRRSLHPQTNPYAHLECLSLLGRRADAAAADKPQVLIPVLAARVRPRAGAGSPERVEAVAAATEPNLKSAPIRKGHSITRNLQSPHNLLEWTNCSTPHAGMCRSKHMAYWDSEFQRVRSPVLRYGIAVASVVVATAVAFVIQEYQFRDVGLPVLVLVIGVVT